MQSETATAKSIFRNKIFRRTGILACSSVLLLFLLGGLVRVTGSGMGCPDWPKCFGLYLPPTCPCQLPHNYHQIFLEKRIAKVDRFVSFLQKIGWKEKAKAIKNDISIYMPEEFNATKAWIEYINRIFGVLAGLFVLAFFVFSLVYRMKLGAIVFSFLALIFLVINAWVGSIVVATNLLPGLVSFHFMISFLCVFSIMMALHKQIAFAAFTSLQKTNLNWVLLFVMVLFEVFLGTLARERSEFLQASGTLTSDNGMINLTGMGDRFMLHRFLPGLIFLFAFYWYWKNRLSNMPEARAFFVVAIIAFVQIAFGASNVVWALPAWSQIVHIVLGSIVPVVIFYYLLGRHRQIKTNQE